MGLDTYIDLEVKRKDSDEFSCFSIIYFRKCASITEKLEKILYKNGIKGEYGYEYPLKNCEVTLLLLRELIKEETSARKYLIDCSNSEESFDFSAFWNHSEYPKIISKEVDNLTDFYYWQSRIIKNQSSVDWFFNESDVELDEYDWNTAKVVFCASW